MEQQDWTQQHRAQLPVLDRCVYLNTGTAGPIPTVSAQAIESAARAELFEGRGDFSGFADFLQGLTRARANIARLINADPTEIALTHHTSEAIHIVLSGLDWRPGDVVATGDLEHDAAMIPLGLLRQRYGVELRIADLGLGERAVEGLSAALTGRVRLVLLSHVSYASGALMPLRQVIELAHAAGAMVLVDGAQSCGALPVDVRELGADFYTVSGQKWLCAPEGTGALFVRSDRLQLLRPLQASYFSVERHDFRGAVELHPDARRFETGMVYRPALAGLNASLEWLIDEVRVTRAWARSLDLARYGRRVLEHLPGVELLTPAAQMSQLLTFDLPAFSPAKLDSLVYQLARDRIVIRAIEHPPYGLRASLGFFSTEAEVDRLAEAIEQIVFRGPDAVDTRGSSHLPDHRDTVASRRR